MRDFFSHKAYITLPDRTGAAATPASPAGNVGSFVSPDSLVTFSGGTAAVTIVSSVLRVLFPAWSQVIVNAVLVALYGAFLFYLDATDPQAPPTPPRPRLIVRIAATIVNTCVLFGATNAATQVVNPPH